MAATQRITKRGARRKDSRLSQDLDLEELDHCISKALGVAMALSEKSGVSGVAFTPENGGEKRVGRYRSMHHESTATISRRATFKVMCLNGQRIACMEKTTGRHSTHGPCPLSAPFQKHADFDPR